jgi:hypothetical protein
MGLLAIPAAKRLVIRRRPESSDLIKMPFCQCIALSLLLAGHRPSQVRRIFGGNGPGKFFP